VAPRCWRPRQEVELKAGSRYKIELKKSLQLN